MTARRKRPKIPRDKLFVRLEFWELDSPAFKALPADAVRVYVDMRQKYNARNNGEIPYTHREAAACLHGGWRRGSNALAALAHFGFIKCRRRGEPGPSSGDNIRPASEWQLTVFPCNGQPASKDFTRWAGEPFEPPARSTLGAKTRETRTSETRNKKQLPIGNMKTLRRQHEDASRPDSDSDSPKRGKSVGNMKTPRAPRRRQHEDTCRYTRGGAPLRQGTDSPAAPVPKRQTGNGRAPSRLPAGQQQHQQAKSADPPKSRRGSRLRGYRGRPVLRDRVLEALRGSPEVWTRARVVATFGVGTGEAQRALSQLVAAGEVERVGVGQYQLSKSNNGRSA